jgi:hypothetical protein
MDTHCLVTANQGTAYGCVRTVVLSGNVLRVSLEPSALAAPGLQDAEIEAVLEAPAEDIARFREVLPQVLAYGREDARPAHVDLEAEQDPSTWLPPTEGHRRRRAGSACRCGVATAGVGGARVALYAGDERAL